MPLNWDTEMYGTGFCEKQAAFIKEFYLYNLESKMAANHNVHLYFV